MTGYDYKFAVDCAHKCIEDAKRYFISGQAMNWICTEVYHALMWGIESWVLRRGIESKSCHGWDALTGQFNDVAPPSIKRNVLYNLHKSVIYDTNNPIEGSIEGDRIDFEDWKSNVGKLISDAEESINILVNSID
jgi:hypothetical protein